MRGVNLIPGERLTRTRRKVRLRIWITSCSTYAVILLGAFALCYAAWGKDNEALAKQLETASGRTDELAQSIEKLTGQLSEAQTTLDASRALGNQPDWSALLALLVRELGDEVVLDSCRLTPAAENKPGSTPDDAAESDSISPGAKRYELRLTGFGKTQTAVSRFVLRLERIELFEGVRLTKSSRGPFLGGQAVAFEIRCSI